MLSNSRFHWLKVIDHWIGKGEAFLLGLAILTMASNAIANVFGRYLFNQSIYFTDELNQFLIVMVTFMGLGYITRTGKHIRMSAVYDILAPRAKKYMMVFIAFTTAVVMLLLAYYALEYVQKIARHGRVTPALQFPLYLTYIWVVAGFALAFFQYFFTGIKNLLEPSDTVYISYTAIDEYLDPEIDDAIQRCATSNSLIESTTESAKLEESKS